jgi:hypothetical protein
VAFGFLLLGLAFATGVVGLVVAARQDPLPTIARLLITADVALLTLGLPLLVGAQSRWRANRRRRRLGIEEWFQIPIICLATVAFGVGLALITTAGQSNGKTGRPTPTCRYVLEEHGTSRCGTRQQFLAAQAGQQGLGLGSVVALLGAESAAILAAAPMRPTRADTKTMPNGARSSIGYRRPKRRRSF